MLILRDSENENVEFELLKSEETTHYVETLWKKRIVKDLDYETEVEIILKWLKINKSLIQTVDFFSDRSVALSKGGILWVRTKTLLRLYSPDYERRMKFLHTTLFVTFPKKDGTRSSRNTKVVNIRGTSERLVPLLISDSFEVLSALDERFHDAVNPKRGKERKNGDTSNE